MINGMFVMDGHIHLLPERLINLPDPVTGAMLDSQGRVHRTDGVVMNQIPGNMEKGFFNCEDLIQLMDSIGVDRAMILQSAFLGISEDISAAVCAYPDRLTGAMSVSPVEESVPLIEKYSKMWLRAIKFEMRGLLELGFYPGLKPNNAAMQQILTEAGKHSVTAVFDTGPMGWKCCCADDLRVAIRDNPGTRFVICHLGQPAAKLLKDKALYDEWENMISLAKYPNVWFDVSAMPNMFTDEGYPFPTASVFMKAFLNSFGEEKLIWGSDAPSILRNATYAETFDIFLKWNIFSENGLERLFGLNALDAYQ